MENWLRGVGLGLAAAAAILASSVDPAQAEERPLVFGARRDAPPISFLKDGRYQGYAVDICDRVRKKFRELYPDRTIAKGYVEVTAGNREDALRDGKVDILCDAFTVTLSRMKKFDFSFPIFITGASVAVRRDGFNGALTVSAGTGSAEDADANAREKGDTKVVAVGNTTTEAAVENLLGKSVELITVTTHDEAFAKLRDGSVTYYFGDQVILNGVVGDSNAFVVSGRVLTYEPYALPVLRGTNADLLYVTNAVIAELCRDDEMLGIFKNNFKDKQPSELLVNLWQLFKIPQ